MCVCVCVREREREREREKDLGVRKYHTVICFCAGAGFSFLNMFLCDAAGGKFLSHETSKQKEWAKTEKQ